MFSKKNDQEVNQIKPNLPFILTVSIFLSLESLSSHMKNFSLSLDRLSQD